MISLTPTRPERRPEGRSPSNKGSSKATLVEERGVEPDRWGWFILELMAKVSAADIRKLGQLARIGLSEAEVKKLVPEIEAILEYVAKLQQVDTKNVKPTNQVTGLTDVWRADEGWKQQWSREELLKNAPRTQDGYVKVPKVLGDK